MKKIVLIEDRPNRQNDFTRNLNCNLNEIPILENICGGESFNNYKEMLVSNDLSPLERFDVIIVHRSALSNSERLKLTEFVKIHSKTLVFFSGGISSVSLQKIAESYLLTINSKELYNNSLINYLNNNASNILELAFGKNWKINLEVSLLDKLVFYINDFQPKPLQIIFSDLKITEWIKETYFKNLEGVIQRSQLEKIKSDIQMNLSKSI